MTTPSSNWRDGALGLARTVLLIAVMLYVAARLILAVLPVLMVAGAVVIVGLIGWTIYEFRRSRW